MLDLIRFGISIVCTGLGLFCLISGVVGVYRFKYSLSRIHAAALFDTVGITLMLAGLMFATGWNVTTGKMLLIIAFLWLTSPVSSHLIGRLEITVNDELTKDMEVIDLEAVRREKEGN